MIASLHGSRRIRVPLVALATLALGRVAAAQGAGAPASIVGDWRGTSICTAAGKPTCHDEVVVYHMRRDTTASGGAGVERLEWVANKIVNGREEEMGTLACEYRPAAAVVTCPMRNWTWRLEARGDSLVGTLANPAGVVWRDVRVARVTAVDERHE
jgi:hypothetical protein